MATAPIHLKSVTVALGYQYNNETRSLAKADPEHIPIGFTLHVTAKSALFEFVIPIKYKAINNLKSIVLRINPLSITSLTYSTKTDLPDAIKSIFPSAICLELRLRQPGVVLIPNSIEGTVEGQRRRSWIALASLYELSHVTSFSIYIADTCLSPDELQFISRAIARQDLEPFSGQDDDDSGMFGGIGAKAATLPAPLLPSYNELAATETKAPLYNEAVTFDPLDTHPRKRKRKPSQEAVADSDVVLTKLGKLEDMFNRRSEQDLCLIQELRAELAGVRGELAGVRGELAGVRGELVEKVRGELVEKVRDELADEVQRVLDENAELVAIREEMDDLGGRIKFIEQEDHELKKEIVKEVVDEIAERIQGH
ncbi:hypothetical protein FGRA07_11741 [Fusarium graminearum]|uniref:Uncharacterized protein n=1 Tax=Gibberella zeae TaxID=5518 RepID=A0A2H3FNG0_GIBZA|nr:hypothetical protein FGRA07_11741 [Fusarium graminearum]